MNNLFFKPFYSLKYNLNKVPLNITVRQLFEIRSEFGKLDFNTTLVLPSYTKKVNGHPVYTHNSYQFIH
jgi:hypothetical protein